MQHVMSLINKSLVPQHLEQSICLHLLHNHMAAGLGNYSGNQKIIIKPSSQLALL